MGNEGLREEKVGVAASPPGLRPFGVEPPAASQAEPLVPNALEEWHSSFEGAMNETYGVSGWKILDLPRMAPEFFDDLLARFGVGETKMIAGSRGNFRIANGRSERTEQWVRATLLVSPAGMENLRRSRAASGIEGEAGDPKGLHPEGESPVPEGQTPTPSSESPHP